MSEVYFIDAIRTPIGRYGGGLAPVRADDLLADTLMALVEKTGVDPAQIQDVFMGCSNQAGEDNRNIARMASLLAGLPDSVPGVTVNRLCGSGLEAVIQAARAIRCGEGDLFLAGGVENMTRAPYSLPKYRGAKPIGNATAYDTALGWRYPNPRMEKRFPLEQMGETAENLAEKYAISRQKQDEYALRSHQQALTAMREKCFREEILPLEITTQKGEILSLDRDEGPREGVSLEKLSRLEPIFQKNGTVTAGNASQISDGAAALTLVSENAIAEYGLKPMARIVAYASSGVEPRLVMMAPVEAVQMVKSRAGWEDGQVELFEINEAFAAQSLALVQEIPLQLERLNIHGGAIALGHPIGASGARILITLLYALKGKGLKRGIAALCLGGGNAVAMGVELI